MRCSAVSEVIRAKLMSAANYRERRRRLIHRAPEPDDPNLQRRERVRRQHLPGPQQLRQQERREQKLKDIREQVAEGKLVIRRMTADERKRYPRRKVGATRRRSKPY